MNKCEWKNGKFKGCEPMEYRIKNHGWVFTILAKRLTMYYNDNGFWFCPFCGADIRKPGQGKKLCTSDTGCLSSWTCETCCFYKPEPEKPFIVKSGGTFVAYDKSVNYLCVKPWDYKNTDMKYIIGLGDEDWKPFTNEKGEHVDKEGKPILELTDEIAKLRSMVTFNGIDLYTLWGYLKEEGINWLLISDGMNDVEWFDNRSNDLHLATPHELQREEE